VIVTSAPANLGGLQSAARGGVTRRAGSKLEDLIGQLQDGLPRSMRSDQPIDGFLVAQLVYFLHPHDAVMADMSFEIDHNPLRQMALQASGAWIASGRQSAPTSPYTLSIEIPELVVESAGMLSRDIRIDALVCTRAPGKSGFTTWTQRCPGIADGARLELASPIVLGWPVRDFVEIHVWVSNDAGEPLARLLEARASSSSVHDAARSLSLDHIDLGASWAAASGAAVLARTAYDALMDTAGTCLGLWRTCFLAHEGFGTGRHPSAGILRTPRFSVSLLIKHVTADKGR